MQISNDKKKLLHGVKSIHKTIQQAENYWQNNQTKEDKSKHSGLFDLDSHDNKSIFNFSEVSLADSLNANSFFNFEEKLNLTHTSQTQSKTNSTNNKTVGNFDTSSNINTIPISINKQKTPKISTKLKKRKKENETRKKQKLQKKTKKFTEDEEMLIMQLYNQVGTNWEEIAKYIPHKSPLMVKNKYYSKLKKKLNKEKRFKVNFKQVEDDVVIPQKKQKHVNNTCPLNDYLENIFKTNNNDICPLREEDDLNLFLNSSFGGNSQQFRKQFETLEKIY